MDRSLDGATRSAAGDVAAHSTGGVATLAREGESFDANRLLEEVRHERAVLASERLVDRALRGSELPAPVRARLERRFTGQVVREMELADAIDEERTVLAELTSSGLIRGMGYEKSIRVTMTEGERLQKAFDQLFDLQEGEKVPQLSGIREAYVAATRDLEVSGITASERLREADTTTASFSFLLGTSMNKRLLKDYQAWPSEWQKFCTITPIKDFKTQSRVRLGAFGSLATVAEDAAYASISLSDTQATYAPAKRGNLVAVTRETIVNDDLYAIKQIPGKLAVAAAFTLAEFVYTLLAANGAVIYDTFKLFDSVNHVNTGIVVGSLGTPNSGAALSTAALQTAVTKMRRQQNMAGKPIGLKPRFLVVPPELEFTAMVITKSAGAPGSNNIDINPMLGYAEVVVAPQIASPTYWIAVADPRVIDTVEVGFVGGQMNPQLFIQDQPLFGNNFTNDVITYKVRHEYGGAVVDYRGFYLGNN
jgi:phage major head subunit gpT-like protein